MANFEWTSGIEIGYPEIDEQHKLLFVLAQAVADPLVSAADHKPDMEKLQVLIDFSQEHFAFEENLMRSSGYPETERHAKYHVALLTELQTYCARLGRGVNTDRASLVDFLRNWLLLHIDTADRELAVWLKKREILA